MKSFLARTSQSNRFLWSCDFIRHSKEKSLQVIIFVACRVWLLESRVSTLGWLPGSCYVDFSICFHPGHRSVPPQPTVASTDFERVPSQSDPSSEEQVPPESRTARGRVQGREKWRHRHIIYACIMYSQLFYLHLFTHTILPPPDMTLFVRRWTA